MANHLVHMHASLYLNIFVLSRKSAAFDKLTLADKCWWLMIGCYNSLAAAEKILLVRGIVSNRVLLIAKLYTVNTLKQTLIYLIGKTVFFELDLKKVLHPKRNCPFVISSFIK